MTDKGYREAPANGTPDLKVAVVGLGAIGRGVVCSFAMAGYQVWAVSRDGRDRMKPYLDREVLKGRISEEERETIVASVTACTVQELPDVELVVEAIVEDRQIKQELFRVLDARCPQRTVLASSTSTIPIGVLAEGLSHPERVVGMHYMTPVPVMKLVEVIKADCTSDEVIERVREYCAATGKVPVVARDVPGFVASRLAQAIINEAVYILEQGVASAADIDLIAKLGLNLPVGPLRLLDECGLDVALRGLDSMRDLLGGQRYEACSLIREKVSEGAYGRKTGVGIYTYNNPSGGSQCG